MMNYDDVAAEARKHADAKRWNVHEIRDGGGNSGQTADECFPSSPLELPDPTTIGVRQLVYGRIMLRKHVTLMSAPSGAGKTAWSIAVAASIASNIELLGDKVHCGGGNVLICSLEDPKDELERRFAACMLHHGLTREQLNGRISAIDGRKNRLTIARLADGSTTNIVYPDLDALIQRICTDNISVVIVDPFVNSHELSENSNEQINAAARAWVRVAEETGCAVLLVHHTKKGAIGGDADSSRGASALNSAVRCHLTLSCMPPDEAERHGIDETQRRLFIRLDDAKSNMSPPSDRIKWFRLVGVRLGNGTPDYPDGDNVQTLEQWTPPKAFSDTSMTDVIRVLEMLMEGPGEGEQYTISRQSQGRWAGQIIVDELGKSEGQAKAMLAAWRKEGVILTENYLSPSRRKDRAGLQVNSDKLEDMRNG